ncbi:hypothetical protein U1Q18_016516 [Sarracenia purpurea var. burkii]
MEESEKRKERLKAMRMEALQPEVDNKASNSLESHHLSNPLIETSPVPSSQMNSHTVPRFDYYTDPMSAFSGNKRRNKVSNQNSQDYFAPPRPRNAELTPSPAHHVQSNYSPDQRSYQAQGPYHSSGSINPEMTPPAHWVQTNYSPDQRIYQARGPSHGSGPRNPEMTPSPAHGIQTNYSPNQIMHQARGPYHSPGPYGSPIGTVSPFGSHQGTPRVWNGSGGNSSYYPPSNSSAVGNFSSPGFGGPGRGCWFGNSPGSGSGRGGSPSSSSGRGRGRWSGNSTHPGLGWGGTRGFGSHNTVSAELRPDLFYDKSMVEDPWKLLKPVLWRRENILVRSLNTPRPGSLESGGIKKARILGTSSESGAEPSLAEYLAAAFSEAVDDGASNDE